MAGGQRVGDLEIEQDLRFQRREWARTTTGESPAPATPATTPKVVMMPSLAPYTRSPR